MFYFFIGINMCSTIASLSREVEEMKWGLHWWVPSGSRNRRLLEMLLVPLTGTRRGLANSRWQQPCQPEVQTRMLFRNTEVSLLLVRFPNLDLSASFHKTVFPHRVGLQVAFGSCFSLSFGTCCLPRGRGQWQNIWGLLILPQALKEKVNSYWSSDLCLWLVANFTLRKIILYWSRLTESLAVSDGCDLQLAFPNFFFLFFFL